MKTETWFMIRVRIIAVLVVLAAGAGGMMWLKSLKTPPKQHPLPVMVAHANGLRVQPETVETVLRGYGTARALRHVRISTEVGGQIVKLHPRLQMGDIVCAGESLCEIDPRVYENHRDRAIAEIAQYDADLARLKQQEANDRAQLEIANSSRDLAQADYERVKKLVNVGGVETKARLEAVALLLNRERLAVLNLENALRLYPTQRLQTDARQEQARVSMKDAMLSLEKCKIAAPITGRVVDKMSEEHQIVIPGQTLVVVADDTVLELPISLNSQEAAQWLETTPDANDASWFAPFAGREVPVRWSEAPETHVWQGRLARVERYDPDTRTVTVIVEIDAKLQSTTAQTFPLVEGMFCAVEIPGRTLEGVFRVPRSAVGHDGSLLLSNSGQLKTRKVTVLKYQGESALISTGLEAGDIVLTTRPAKIIDGTPVEVLLPDEDANNLTPLEKQP